MIHTTVSWNYKIDPGQSTAAKASVWVASANAQAASNNAQLSQSQISQVFQAVTNNTMPPLPKFQRKARTTEKIQQHLQNESNIGDHPGKEMIVQIL